MTSLLHSLVTFERALRLELKPQCGATFAPCDCDRIGRTGAKCSLCLADDLRRLIVTHAQLA